MGIPRVVQLALVGAGLALDLRQQGIENRRAEEEREHEEQLAQDAALQAYLDQMSTLLIEKDLRNAEGNREVNALARARTLTVLERLDPTRKVHVIRFLSSEASLVQSPPGTDPVMSLLSADLSGVDLTYATPGDAQPYAAVPVLDLSGADLTYADLSGANLSGIVMHGTRLVGADLRGADLRGADLSYTVLHDANLSGANLRHATGKTGEQLDGQAGSLEGAIMPNGQKYEEWLNDKKGRRQDGENSGTS